MSNMIHSLLHLWVFLSYQQWVKGFGKGNEGKNLWKWICNSSEDSWRMTEPNYFKLLRATWNMLKSILKIEVREKANSLISSYSLSQLTSIVIPIPLIIHITVKQFATSGTMRLKWVHHTYASKKWLNYVV